MIKITANHFTTRSKFLEARKHKGYSFEQKNSPELENSPEPKNNPEHKNNPGQTSSPEPASGNSITGNLDDLLSRNPALWRGCDMAGRGDFGQPTGYSPLDDILPGRGWPRNAMVEIISSQWGMGELQLLVPLMRETVSAGKWILWISPPYLLYAPALVQAGINTEQVLVVRLDTSCKDALWSMEKALQTESCGLVLAWQNWLPNKVMRRLQLAAENGKTLGVLFHKKVSKHSQSSLTLKIKGSPSESPSRQRNKPGTGNTEITVIRARGNFRPLSVQLDLHQHQPHYQE